jgi:hypothetical protein
MYLNKRKRLIELKKKGDYLPIITQFNVVKDEQKRNQIAYCRSPYYKPLITSS